MGWSSFSDCDRYMNVCLFSFSSMNMLRFVTKIICGVDVCALLFFAVAPLVAQDAVVQRKPDGSLLRRKGRIVDWVGLSLTLDQAGRIREIDNAEIDSIETSWPPSYLSAIEKMNRMELAGAIEGFTSAVGQEQRPWARTIVFSKLTIAYQMTDQYAAACESFFQLVEHDPYSRFLYLAPLPWEVSKSVTRVPAPERVLNWFDQATRAGDQPAKALVAASWLMLSQRQSARPVLEGLATDLDPTLASMAVGQLWLGRKDKMSKKRLAVWRKRLELMPLAARGGPLYALALAELRSEVGASVESEAGAAEGSEALRDLMRIAILYPDQQIIAAPALYRAAGILQNKGRVEIADSLLQELKSRFPQSPWVK